MENRRNSRSVVLGSAILVAAFLTACEGPGTSDLPTGLDVQAAKGGRGGGPGGGGEPPAPPPMLSVSGGVNTPSPQPGAYNVKRKEVAIGLGEVRCEEGETPDAYDQCFDSWLDYAAGIDKAACTPDPLDLPQAEQDALWTLLSDPEQQRWGFHGDINTGKWTADFRTFWYEDMSFWGNGIRFVILHFNQDASSPGADYYEMTGGDVTIIAEGQGAQLSCQYTGGLNILVTP